MPNDKTTAAGPENPAAVFILFGGRPLNQSQQMDRRDVSHYEANDEYADTLTVLQIGRLGESLVAPEDIPQKEEHRHQPYRRDRYRIFQGRIHATVGQQSHDAADFGYQKYNHRHVERYSGEEVERRDIPKTDLRRRSRQPRQIEHDCKDGPRRQLARGRLQQMIAREIHLRKRRKAHPSLPEKHRNEDQCRYAPAQRLAQRQETERIKNFIHHSFNILSYRQTILYVKHSTCSMRL